METHNETQTQSIRETDSWGEKMQAVYSAAIPVNGIQLPGNLHVLLTECFIDVTVILYFISQLSVGAREKAFAGNCANTSHLAVLSSCLRAVSAWGTVAHLSGTLIHGRGWMHIQQMISYIGGKTLLC